MAELRGIDLLDLDPDDPAYYDRLEERLTGTYNTGWCTLKMAAASSIMLAAERTSKLLALWDRIRQKVADRAEAKFLVDFNYDIHALGPCLSSVLLTAFSLESFLRLSMHVALEIARTDSRRREGFDAVTVARLKSFEELSFEKKLNALAVQLKCPSLARHDQRQQTARDLIAYRNECVHETPSVTLGFGKFEKALTGRERQPGLIEKKMAGYERLSLSNRPVRLKHVVKAVEAHDAIVRHFLAQLKGSRWHQEMRALDASLGDGTLATCLVSTIRWSTVRQLSRAWEDGPERDKPTAKENREFGLSIRRRTQLKEVR